MQHLAIHGRKIKPESVAHVQLLLKLLSDRRKKVSVSRSFYQQNRQSFDLDLFSVYPDDLSQIEVDAVFSLGGDGTLLETVTHVGRTEYPILGINTGRLGFLATIGETEIQSALHLLFEERYRIENRTLVQLQSSASPFGNLNFGLNEFAILRRDTSSMINVHCYLNDEYLNTYWADGIMVSTPTGSTGYSLSCGGPILMPDTQNFIITPVSPHNLTIRPLVIPDDGVLHFEIETRDTNLLISLDSRSATISPEIEIKVNKAAFSAKLITLEGSSFVETLRNKLGWGLDKRN